MASTQPVIQFDVDGDVRAVAAMAAALTPYIYENELYGAMLGSLPRLTVGGLLMRLHRLSAIRSSLTPAQQQTVAQAQAQFDQVRKEWAVAYEGKLQRELPVRVKTYSELIKDCSDDLRRCADIYPSEIEKRVIIEGLRAEAEKHHVLDAQVANQIQSLDATLRRFTMPADFIWDKRLEPAYPRDQYGYLYAVVKK